MPTETLEDFLARNVKHWELLTPGMRKGWIIEANNAIDNRRANGESISFEISAYFSNSGYPVIWIGE